MINMIHADLYKMWKSTVIKVLFIFTFVCAIISCVITNGIANGTISSSLSNIGFLFGDANMLSIVGAILAGTLICGDFDNKVIHEAITAGCSRTSIIVSKAVTYLIACMTVIIPYGIVNTIALLTGAKFSLETSSVGFLNLLTTEQGLITGSNVLKLVGIMLVILLVYLAQLSACIPLALNVKKPVIVVGAFYGMTISMAQLSAIAAKSEGFDKVYSLLPFGGKHLFLTLEASSGDIVKAIVVSVVFILVMIGVTNLGFRKTEIK